MNAKETATKLKQWVNDHRVLLEERIRFKKCTDSIYLLTVANCIDPSPFVGEMKEAIYTIQDDLKLNI